VLFCTDNNYWQHLGATLASLLGSNAHHQFRIIICSIQKNAESEAKIRQIAAEARNAAVEFVNYTPSRRESLPINRYITLGAYLRLFMADYVDVSVEKLLYLDCDLIVRKDIGPLWAASIDDYSVAAVPESYFGAHDELGFSRNDLYFNSGVMLVNLARWRRDDLITKFIACAKEKSTALTYWDQDILNIVLRGQAAFLSQRWNFHAIYAEMLPEHLGLKREEFFDTRRDPAIIHYTSKHKPWQYFPEPQYKQYYWEALARTPWKGIAPQGHTAVNSLRKAMKLKWLKQQIRLHGAQFIYWFSRFSGKRMLWSDVVPPPNHVTVA
jgi:lipopolysaccharide biosynthesis glycosyltransferase